MGSNAIFIHLSSLILKKGLSFYLQSWGYTPLSITREGLLNAALREREKPILICDESIFSKGIPFSKNYKLFLLIGENSLITNSESIKEHAYGICSLKISPADFSFALRQICIGKKYFQPDVFKKREVKSTNGQLGELTVLSDLTTREREVLRHIANEYTNKEIAEILFISPRTVETHRRNLIQKLKVKNSVGLVKIYLEARYIA